MVSWKNKDDASSRALCGLRLLIRRCRPTSLALHHVLPEELWVILELFLQLKHFVSLSISGTLEMFVTYNVQSANQLAAYIHLWKCRPLAVVFQALPYFVVGQDVEEAVPNALLP